MSAQKPQVQFTRKQFEYLTAQFPELTGTSNTSAEERTWRAAQRAVVHFIGTKVQHQPGG